MNILQPEKKQEVLLIPAFDTKTRVCLESSVFILVYCISDQHHKKMYTPPDTTYTLTDVLVFYWDLGGPEVEL